MVKVRPEGEGKISQAILRAQRFKSAETLKKVKPMM